MRLNAAANEFFNATLPTLDRTYLRPRYDGYLRFQDEAGRLVHEYLERGGDSESVLARMEETLQASRRP